MAAIILHMGNISSHCLARRQNLNCLRCCNAAECYIMQIQVYVDGLVQDCSISTANALKILQSCTKPLMYFLKIYSACKSKAFQRRSHVCITSPIILRTPYLSGVRLGGRKLGRLRRSRFQWHIRRVLTHEGRVFVGVPFITVCLPIVHSL